MKFTLMTLANLLPAMFGAMEQGKEPPVEAAEELLAAASAAGIEAVDFSTLEIAGFGKECLRDLLEKYGLKMGALINFSDLAVPGKEDGVEAEAREAVELCKFFGTDVMMIAPSLIDVELTCSRQESRDRLIRNFALYADLCGQNGITPVIEDAPNLEIPMCRTEEMDKLFSAVDGLYMVYDSGNVILVHEDPVEYCRHFMDRIRYVHLKDMLPAGDGAQRAECDENGEPFVSAQTGEGLIDFAGIIRVLDENGYDGYLLLEYPMRLPGSKSHEELLKDAVAYIESLS